MKSRKGENAMAERKTAVKSRKTAQFTEAERAAMKERVRELKSGDADTEAEVREKIAGMGPADRAMAERFHAIVKATAPHLTARLWYGMPAYARDGKVVCHFKDAAKFKTRYANIEFSDAASLDDGDIWPIAFALQKLTPAVEARITALVKKAVS
jgi:uncharacterized protein YdhG (YjbR/CyaY superfamily)